MSTHNICFCGEMRKMLCEYPFLSEAVVLHKLICVCMLMTLDQEIILKQIGQCHGKMYLRAGIKIRKELIRLW